MEAGFEYYNTLVRRLEKETVMNYGSVGLTKECDACK